MLGKIIVRGALPEKHCDTVSSSCLTLHRERAQHAAGAEQPHIPK